ncbi:response regulator [Hansschlegelia plantiphila]|nr:response regulator [Hansschlegelia plantiphila]
MRVLIVDDDMMVAGRLAPIVVDAGHELVGLAADRDTAVALLRSAKVHLVLVGLRLANGWTGGDMGAAAAAHGVAVVFTTADAALGADDRAAAAGVIARLSVASDVTSALDYFAATLAGAAPPVPRGLELFAEWSATGAPTATAAAAQASHSAR